MVQRQFSRNVTFSMRGTWPKRGFLLIIEKEEKVRFQKEIAQKPNIIQRQFSQNVMFFLCDAHRLFWLFFVKK